VLAHFHGVAGTGRRDLLKFVWGDGALSCGQEFERSGPAGPIPIELLQERLDICFVVAVVRIDGSVSD